MAVAQPCGPHEQDRLLFQHATLGKEEGKLLATAQAEPEHDSPGQHSLVSPPIQFPDGQDPPAARPGARYCGKVSTLLFR